MSAIGDAAEDGLQGAPAARCREPAAAAAAAALPADLAEPCDDGDGPAGESAARSAWRLCRRTAARRSCSRCVAIDGMSMSLPNDVRTSESFTAC